jgi:hypothetical protein
MPMARHAGHDNHSTRDIPSSFCWAMRITFRTIRRSYRIPSSHRPAEEKIFLHGLRRDWNITW